MDDVDTMINKIKQEFRAVQKALDNGKVICPYCKKEMKKIEEHEYEPTCDCYAPGLRVMIG